MTELERSVVPLGGPVALVGEEEERGLDAACGERLVDLNGLARG